MGRIKRRLFEAYKTCQHLGGEDISHGTDVSVQLAGENSGAPEAILFTNSSLGSILVRKEKRQKLIRISVRISFVKQGLGKWE